MIPLPYADDIRDSNSILAAAGFEKKGEQADEKGIIETLTKEEKHAAKLLVKNLNIEFDSRNFENPTIQKFYSGLQAMALNEEDPEEFEDLLEPDYEGMRKFTPVLNNFKDIFYNGYDEDPEIAEKPKRGAPKKSVKRAAAMAFEGSSQNSRTSSRSGRGRGRGRGGRSNSSNNATPTRVDSKQEDDPIMENVQGENAEESELVEKIGNKRRKVDPVSNPEQPKKRGRGRAKK